MSTLRVSNIEAKADPSSPTVNEKVKITNSNGDVMLQLDGATSGITTVGINTTTAAFTVDGAQNINFVGVVTAASLSGNLTGNVTGDVTAGVITATSSIVVGDKFINSSGVGIGTTTTAGRNAGVGTAVGTLILNTTTNRIEAYGPEGWINVKSFVNSGLTATGGIIGEYESGGTVYRTHTFTTSGTFQVTALSDSLSNDIDYLVIAGGGGGGGGGYGGGGGGGAGGFRTSAGPSGGGASAESAITAEVQSYTVTVGAGGLSGYYAPKILSTQGSPSVFGTITSTGGGAGAHQSPAGAPFGGSTGGSGGGGGGAPGGTPPGFAGTANQGYAGGDGETVAPDNIGGGGGGAGGAGTPGVSGGAGGDGLASSITGTSVTYAGGGGGSSEPDSEPGPGSPGGGGAGTAGAEPNTPNPGTYATGSGGGGGYTEGGDGAPGIVVVRYQIGSTEAGTAKATGGSVSFYNNKTIHTFTTTGSFVVPASFNETVEYLVIGGGGSGSVGGGGAGGYVTGTTPISTPQTISVTVGSGGAGGQYAPRSPSTPRGYNGSPSSFGPSFIAYGGGAGSGVGVDVALATGTPGGSGGGGSRYAGGIPGGDGSKQTGTSTDASITPQGNPGGTGMEGPQYGSGAGGGAGGAGGDAAPTSGSAVGGLGLQAPTTFRDPSQSYGYPGPSGTYWFAGGGGGGHDNALGNGSPGPGPGGGPGGPYAGAGGGATGPTGPGPLIDAKVNSGSGGGSSTISPYPGLGRSGSGGSGIVLIAYPT